MTDGWQAAFKATGWSPTGGEAAAGSRFPIPSPGAAAAPSGARPVDPYLGLVKDTATRHGLSPSLLAGVWDFESSGNPKAVNKSSGATGLGQVMPRERGFPDRPTQQELLNPETNAEWSARILKSGLDRYGSEDKALAAYLGAIDARGNITGAVDAMGTGGNQYIRTVRERQQRYSDLASGDRADRGPAPARTQAPEASADWKQAFRAAGWSPDGGRQGAPSATGATGATGRPVEGAVVTRAGQPYWSFGGGAHAGIDISAKAGTDVRAPVAGEVVANLAQGQNPLGLSAGYGRAVAVRDTNGDVHVFGHGAPGFAYPPVGTKVGVGQVISRVGSPETRLPGEATEGEHLHWEIRGGGDYGRQIDPEAWLSDRALPATNDPRQALTSAARTAGAAVAGVVGDWKQAFRAAGWRPGA